MGERGTKAGVTTIPTRKSNLPMSSGVWFLNAINYFLEQFRVAEALNGKQSSICFCPHTRSLPTTNILVHSRAFVVAAEPILTHHPESMVHVSAHSVAYIP